MKKLSFITLILASVFSACQGPIEPTPGESVVVIPDGAVELKDAQFGMYYGDLNNDGTGVFSLVLTDALCYQDKIGSPYMDSEGDMVVLQFRTAVLASDATVALPEGKYNVADEVKENVIYAPESYITRMTGTTQVKWGVKSGLVSVAKGDKGDYTIVAEDLIIEKDSVVDTVDYYCTSSIVMSDYAVVAPLYVGLQDDVVNLPFPYMSCTYYGDLIGSGCGNFIVNIATKGFIDVNSEGTEYMNDVPGIYITMNFLSRLYNSGSTEPKIEEGRYDVSSSFSRWTVIGGMYMQYADGSTSPFGTYVLHQPAEGDGTMEFITGGYVDLKYEEDICVLEYTFKTSSRTISGTWRGEMPVNNLTETSAESFLTTLDHDVDCDMSKVTSGTLRHIETLRRKLYDIDNNDIGYDVAEAWQLYLQPRDWTAEEKNIPWVDAENENGADGIPGTEDDWMYDKNQNGIRDRLEAWCADGDVMVLEFILPLGSQGTIAPELNKTYTYTMQPSLTKDHELYEVYVSQMGRPADEIFDMIYGQEQQEQGKQWSQLLGLDPYNEADFDRCNSRRGFTWSEDGFRGNWYLHYEKGQHMMLDEHAPAINGWVKVTRTADDIYDFEWDFIDDNPGTPNKITGSIKDCKVSIYLN